MMKGTVSKLRRFVCTALAASLTATMFTSVASAGNNYSAFSNYAEEQRMAAELNETIAEESYVLMKNNGALPLASAQRNVTMFGIASAYPSYGAQGSGTQSVSDTQTLVTLKEGLENAGINVNTAVFEAYRRAGAAAYATASAETSIGNVSAGVYIINSDLAPEALSMYESSYALYGDAAIVVVAREGGEGETYEFSRTNYYGGGEKEEGAEYAHALMLTPSEKSILAYAEENFETVIVLVNTTNVMELGELEDDDRVDAVLWIGAPGVTGMNSLGRVLTGEANPSGRTSDIWPANLTQDPTWFNYGDQSGAISTAQTDAVAGEASKAYDQDGNEVTLGATGIETVSYLEGIYMGYRWYETQAELGNYFATDSMPNNAAASYDAADAYYNRGNGVVYPFGYGLSYTTFDWTDFSAVLSEDGTNITATVTVTNTGDVAGKDVVQIYYKDPYCDGQIEKASANLVDFAKTRELQPGQSETVTITFAVKDMAAFDYSDANGNGFKGYELDAGDYIISARSDSHTVRGAATIALDAFLYDGSDEAHNYNAGYGENAEAVFSSDDLTSGDWLYNSAGDPAVQEYASRAGGTLSLPKAVLNAKYSDEWVERLTVYQTYTANDVQEYHEKYGTFCVTDLPDNWTQAEEGTAETTAIRLSDMVGVGYPTYTYDKETGTITAGDDEATRKWDAFLNQLTIREMYSVVNSDHGNSQAAERYGLPRSYCNDGPSKLQDKSGATLADGTLIDGTWWASEVNIASTWNVELAYMQGLYVGNESLYEGVVGMWGFGLNTHRGAWGARTFEYYAEDGVLAGYISAAVTKGCTDMGVIVYNKHFALNDQDEYRATADGAAVFVTEQALRQIYLKPYELAVKLGNMNGVMMSFMRVGAISADNNYNLITKTLRGEWGFEGDACTDAGGGYDGDAVIQAGNDWPLMNYTVAVLGEWDAAQNCVAVDGQVNKTQYYAIRTGAMHFFYSIANSNAMKNGVNTAAFKSQELEAVNGRSTGISLAADLSELNASYATYSLTGGELPGGLTIDSNGNLSGTPVELGTYSFTVRMTADDYISSNADFTLTVNRVFSESCTEGTVGDEDFECVVSSDYVKVGDEYQEVTYSAIGLPAGLVIAEDGVIYGTPEAAGTYEVTVKAVANGGYALDIPEGFDVGLLAVLFPDGIPMKMVTYTESFVLTITE